MKTILSTAALVLAGLTVAAQDVIVPEIPGGNSEPVTFMNINPDIRGQAMGGISTGLEGNAYSVFNNAAAATFSRKFIEGGVSYTPWMKNFTEGTDLKYKLLGIGTYFKVGGRSTILVGARYFNAGKDIEKDADGNVIHESKSRNATVDVGYAFRISQHFSVSLTARWVYDHLGGASAKNAIGADVGFMYHADFGDRVVFNAGAALNNVGSKIDGETMPAKVSAGASAAVRLGAIHTVSAGVDVGYKICGLEGTIGGVGVEYNVWNLLSVRGGYHFGEEKSGSFNYGTVGAGLRLFDMVQADFFYALAKKDSPMRKTWGISVGVRF